MRFVALLLGIAARPAHADCSDRETAAAMVAAATAANEARFTDALERAKLQ